MNRGGAMAPHESSESAFYGKFYHLVDILNDESRQKKEKEIIHFVFCVDEKFFNRRVGVFNIIQLSFSPYRVGIFDPSPTPWGQGSWRLLNLFEDLDKARRGFWTFLAALDLHEEQGKSD